MFEAYVTNPGMYPERGVEVGEYESLDELNFLAHLLEEMTPDELEKPEAVKDAGEYTGSIKDLINLTQNLDCFKFYPGVKDEEDLGGGRHSRGIPYYPCPRPGREGGNTLHLGDDQAVSRSPACSP